MNPPRLQSTLTGPHRYASPEWARWFNDVYAQVKQNKEGLQTSGTTADRPTSGLWVGRMYFDTTLGKPVWVKSLSPVTWVDATGASV